MVDDKVIIRNKFIYPPNPMNFGWMRRNGQISWTYCRDIFHSEYDVRAIASKQASQFFYADINFKIITELLARVEIHLKIIPSQINWTDCANVIAIIPSDFWREDRMRLSLLTIILRSAKDMPGKTWMDILLESPYLSSNKLAVELFFSGHNCFHGHGFGWLTVFGGVKESKTKKMLSSSRSKFGWLPSW